MKTPVIAFGLLGATTLVGLAHPDARRDSTSLRVNWMHVLARHPDLPTELEPSTRFAVPASVADDVWSFLMSQQRDVSRVAQITDWSYDTPTGQLRERWIVVRLRTRPDDAPKVQIKAYDFESGHAAELSFDATANEPRALTSLIQESQRPAFDASLALLGIDPNELRVEAPLLHARVRVALERDGTKMKASLDHLTWAAGEHRVLELTPEATENERGVMTLTRELRTLFPALQIDPAPKIIAAGQRTPPSDDTDCVWAAAGLMCRRAVAATAPTGIVPPVAAAETQAMPQAAGLSPFPNPRGFAMPLGTGLP